MLGIRCGVSGSFELLEKSRNKEGFESRNFGVFIYSLRILFYMFFLVFYIKVYIVDSFVFLLLGGNVFFRREVVFFLRLGNMVY